MENKNVILLSASSNSGTGFFTMLCVFFANIFGVESKNFKAKQERVIDNIKEGLSRQMAKYPNYQFEDFRIVKDGSLAYTGTVLGVRDPNYVPSKEAEAVSEETKEEVVESIDYEALTDEGRDYFNNKQDYKKAFQCFEKASAGSMRAKYNLAYLCYYKGYGTKKDTEKAIKLLQELADAGYEKAAEALKEIKK